MIRKPVELPRPARWAACIAIAGLVLGGCSSGGDGGGGPLPPAPPATCLAFSGGTAPVAGTVVAQLGTGSTCARLAVDLIVTGVADIFAIEFTAVFDSSLYAYDGLSTQGSILESGGAAVQALQSGPAGQKLIAISRLGPAGGVNMDGKLVTVFFRKVAGSGSGALALTGAKVLDSQTPPMQIGGVTWFGATLSIQ